MKKLMEAINLPAEAAQAVLAADRSLPRDLDVSGLTREETWQSGRAALLEKLGPDPGGFKELACMLRCAMAARETYEELGIGEKIYRDTFACFTRFVREHRDSFGSYGFDRGFWTVRQVSCKLFRIGELEYESIRMDGEPVISLHIPSDARLEPGELRRSYLDARALLGRAFPEYAGARMYCHSWLLSPTLKELLPPGSRILRFQESFAVTPLAGDNREYRLWVFKNPSLPPEDYPEETSLQRKLKARILEGGTLTDAKGFLVREPFV